MGLYESSDDLDCSNWTFVSFVCAASVTCNPVDTAQIDQIVHVMNSDGTDIHWFSLPTTGNGDESRTASRFMVMALTAITSGKQMGFWFNTGDTSG